MNRKYKTVQLEKSYLIATDVAVIFGEPTVLLF